MLIYSYILYSWLFFIYTVLELTVYKKENILNSVYILLNYLGSNTLIFNFLMIILINKKYKNFCILSLVIFFYSSIYKQSYPAFPQTLLFGYNIYHPPMFYITYFLILNLFLSARSRVKISNNFTFFLISFSLILGMFWGSIHSSWGFFWSSDYIEYILLLTSTLVVCKIHTIFFKFNQKFYYYIIVNLLLFILLLRLNFFTTIHSFFQNFYLKNILNIFNTISQFFKINVHFIFYTVLSLIFILALFLIFTILIDLRFKIIKLSKLLIFLHIIVFIVIIKFTVNFFLYFVSVDILSINHFSTIFNLKKKYLNLDAIYVKKVSSLKTFKFVLYMTNNFNSHKYFIYLSLFYYYYLWLISFLKIFKK